MINLCSEIIFASSEYCIQVCYLFQDANGSIGLTAQGNIQPLPVEIKMDEVIVKICSGNDHLACLTDSGEILTWGKYL